MALIPLLIVGGELIIEICGYVLVGAITVIVSWEVLNSLDELSKNILQTDGLIFQARKKGGEKGRDKEADPVSKDIPPTEKDGYIAPKGGPKKGKTKDGKTGWVDEKGNIWVPAPTGSPNAHGGGHWDVQSSNGRGYINVYPGGTLRKGAGIPPVLPPWVNYLVEK